MFETKLSDIIKKDSKNFYKKRPKDYLDTLYQPSGLTILFIIIIVGFFYLISNKTFNEPIWIKHLITQGIMGSVSTGSPMKKLHLLINIF